MSSITITITITILILIVISLTTTSASTFGGDDGNLTVYEVIESYGFPKGILPIGVTGYELDKPTGKFKAFFNGTCSFSLEGTYDLKYQSTISGVISNGRLKNLTGVSVKLFIFWLNIVEVYTTDNELGFSVGIASASFPIGNFEDCPQCGCGMDCNVTELKIGRNRFVSSL